MWQVVEPNADADTSENAGMSSIEEQAIEWVVKLTSGETTAADRMAFRRWRASSAEHEAALVAARQLWVDVGPAIPPPTRVRVSPRQNRWRPYAAAASLLLAVAIGFSAIQARWHDDVTGTGERRSVALADQSQVELSTDTAIDVNFSDAERRVTLVRGEAYFDVTSNAQRPFIVKAGEGEVRVVGTAFSVRRDDAGVTVTVERGRVEVNDGGSPVVLTPGLRVRYLNGAHTPVTQVDPNTALAWRRGRLIVEDQPLADIVRELDRYRSGKILVLDRTIGARRMNAVIDLDRIDDWLLALGQSQQVKVQRWGPVVLIR